MVEFCNNKLSSRSSEFVKMAFIFLLFHIVFDLDMKKRLHCYSLPRITYSPEKRLQKERPTAMMLFSASS